MHHLPPGILYEDETFRLRYLELTDASSLAKNCDDPLISKYVGSPYPYTESDAMVYIKESKKKWHQGVTYNIAIDIDNGVVGIVGIMDVDPRHKTAELGYWLGKEYRGQGLMTAAIGRIIPIAVERLGLQRLWARTDPSNEASANVLKANGFTQEGILRKHVILGDIRRDVVMWGYIPEECDI